MPESKINLPRLPGAALLVGYPPMTVVTTAKDTWRVPASGYVSRILPSISRDGLIVATALAENEMAPYTIGTYSVLERKWRPYKTLRMYGAAIAVSPDGSTVAFTLPDLNSPDKNNLWARLHLIDLGTGKENTLKWEAGKGTTLSWSPDGRRLVCESSLRTHRDGGTKKEWREIYVLDLETGESSKIATGEMPA
jgi:dipeptidyl aminopeptidase/acylaminoacyl peptidase